MGYVTAACLVDVTDDLGGVQSLCVRQRTSRIRNRACAAKHGEERGGW